MIPSPHRIHARARLSRRCCRARRPGRAARRASSCSPARAARPARPADKLLGELAQGSVAGRDDAGGRLLGLSRLEGHAGAQAATPTGSAPMPSARGDREVYTPQVVVNGIVHVLGSDKAAIERAIAQSRKQPRRSRLPVTASVARRQAHGQRAGARTTSAAARSGSARSPRRCRSRSAAARTAAAPSPTPTWCGAGSSSANGPARPQTFSVPLERLAERRDRSVAVLVQSGAASAPKRRCSARRRSSLR